MTRPTRTGLRRIGGALPALALVGAGTTLVVTAGGAAAPVAESRPLVTVPSTPLEQPPGQAVPPLPQLPAPPEQQPTPFDSPPAVPASMSADGIPAVALAAYRRAAAIVDAADQQCRIDWALIAAIGKVESDHGRYGGNGIDSDGTVRPGIIGIPLDGAGGTAVVHDTDAGFFDHDSTWDRAVGPMQFIPSTWRTVGVDANGDGRKDPQNFLDAATATAVYLCSGPGDLSSEPDARAAVLRYNHSEAYADEVLAIADGYRNGYTVDPASALTAEQRDGSPFLPSGQPQTMQQYNPAAVRPPAPAPASKPLVRPTTGTPAARPTSAASGGSSPGSASVAGAATKALTGVVSGATGSPAPTPAATPTPAPTPTTTPVVVLPVIGPLGVPVCPNGYRLSLDGKSCRKL